MSELEDTLAGQLRLRGVKGYEREATFAEGRKRASEECADRIATALGVTAEDLTGERMA